jgi:RNA polymerase sigma-70 factor (ECF subfamily)
VFTGFVDGNTSRGDQAFGGAQCPLAANTRGVPPNTGFPALQQAIIMAETFCPSRAIWYVDEPLGEQRLIELARQGNEASFLAIYERHRVSVFRFAYRFTGSAALAEDVTQECFLSLLSGGDFDPRRGALRSYLLGTARHIAMKLLRVTGREMEEIDEPVTATGPLAIMLTAERSRLVKDAILQLPPLQREALILFEYEELSLEDIAGITSTAVPAVKSRLHRAREALRRRLAPILAVEGERKSS